jgi:preprotein translocase subunit SecA
MTFDVLSLLTGAIVGGAVNYYLQKKNRKGNALYEKGYELIDKIKSMNEERVRVFTIISLYNNLPKEQINKLFYDYSKKCDDFKLDVHKYSILFNKETNIKLNDFISYLEEMKTALLKLENGEDFIVNFDNNSINELCNQIIKLIKKQTA